MAAYADEMKHYPAAAVTAGCLQWGRQKASWPSLSELVAFIETNDLGTPRGLPDPSKAENFLARCKRVGRVDALWIQAHHHWLQASMVDHYEGTLTDQWLAKCLQQAGEEHFAQPINRRPELNDTELLVAWKENDDKAKEIRGNMGSFFCAKALLDAHANFHSRRFRDHPLLTGEEKGVVT